MDDSPDPLTDLRKGLGLLLRAARTAARNLPAKDLEEVVTTSAREVGRALENVASTIEREIRGKVGPPPPPAPPTPSQASPQAKDERPKDEHAKDERPQDEGPRKG